MAYIAKNLRPGEKVHFVAKPRSIIMWSAALVLFVVAAISFGSGAGIVAALFFMLFLGGLGAAWSTTFSEIAVTNKRLVYKKGLLSSVHDIPLAKIESRMVGALGHVTISGTGIGQIKVPALDKVQATKLIAAIDEATEKRVTEVG